jgi:hypothetical protein
MLLGDLLARFETSSFAEETVLALGDLRLLARMQVQADAEGLSLGAFAKGAMRRFAAGASDEEWVTLLGALARAEDPGAACLTFAFKHVMEQLLGTDGNVGSCTHG